MLFKSNSISLIILTGSLLAAGPLATDMFVPALPAIGIDLQAPVSSVQLTLSCYLVSFAFGQLFWGPVSDSYGRKPTILLGCIFFVISCVICTFASTIEVLVLGRVLQGFAVAFGQILGRSIIRDLHSSEEAPRIMALSTMLMGIASLIGPNIGALTVAYFGWQPLFVILTIYGLVVFVIILFIFSETNNYINSNSINIKNIFFNFLILLKDRNFLSYSISLTCIFGCLFSFIANSPYVFINVFDMETKKFGLVFSSIAIVFILANFINSRLLKKINTFFLFKFGLFVAVLGGLISITAAVLAPNVISLLLGMMFISFSMGFIVPIGFANCMKNHPEIAGTASTLIGFMQAVFSALVAAITGILFNQTAIPMTTAMALLSAVALLMFIFINKNNG
tara:strand:- start:1673 stop:2857 length:1185 start_codon:yes stop_codon:yes gene_type:complete